MSYRVIQQPNGAYQLVRVPPARIGATQLPAEDAIPAKATFDTLDAMNEELDKMKAALSKPTLIRKTYREDSYQEEVPCCSSTLSR